MSDPLVRRSKHLSKVLRHDPGSVGLSLDEAGWVDVVHLLMAMGWTMGQLDEVVTTNNKKRFEYNADKTRIRASQGHSVDVDLGYEKRVPPATPLYHGTAARLYQTITLEGIRKMNRQHVHLSADVATARTVGARHGKPCVLVVNASRMHVDGHAFYLSTNGVWLTDHVPAGYFYLLEDL